MSKSCKSRTVAPSTRCPYCGSFCKCSKTEQKTAKYREGIYICMNDKCGAVFIASIDVVRMLKPSYIPRPDLNIPVLNLGPAAPTAET